MSSALSVAPLLLHDTGVSPTRTRRQFTATYKLQILAAADACTKPGELGALLRREGLYSSHLAVWRAARRRGDLQGPANSPRRCAVRQTERCDEYSPSRRNNAPSSPGLVQASAAASIWSLYAVRN